MESQDYSQKCKVEQRLVRNRTEEKSLCLLNEFFCYDPYCHEASDQEHDNACKTEEMHRLLAECAEEPEGNQVKKTVYESFKTEFADTVFPFLVLYRLFCDTVESSVLCKIRYVAMHFAIYLDILDDFVSICLETAVHVMKLDAGDLAGCGIVEL